MKNKLILISLITLTISVSCNAQSAVNEQQTADQIRTETLRKNNDPVGHALPLIASWNTGTYLYVQPYYKKRGMDPAYQLDLLKDGHHIFPTLAFPAMDATVEKWQEY